MKPSEAALLNNLGLRWQNREISREEFLEEYESIISKIIARRTARSFVKGGGDVG